MPDLATSDATAVPKNGSNERDWTYIVEMPVPPRHGKEQPPRPACLWLPGGVEKVRGLFYPGGGRNRLSPKYNGGPEGFIREGPKC